MLVLEAVPLIIICGRTKTRSRTATWRWWVGKAVRDHYQNAVKGACGLHTNMLRRGEMAENEDER